MLHNGLLRNWFGVQQLPNPIFQSGEAERFLEQVDSRVKQAIVTNRVFGVSGDIQHTDFRPLRGDLRCQLPTIHPRHDNIGKKKIDGAAMTGCDLQRGGAIFGIENPVPLIP